MITEANFTESQRELYDLMSDISEDCYCAGWLMGNEYNIWAALQDGDLSYGRGVMDAESLERFRELSAELQGWIIWADDDMDKDMPVAEWGPRFITLGKWIQMVAAQEQGK